MDRKHTKTMTISLTHQMAEVLEALATDQDRSMSACIEHALWLASPVRARAKQLGIPLVSPDERPLPGWPRKTRGEKTRVGVTRFSKSGKRS